MRGLYIFSQLSPLVILTMPVEIYSYGWQYTLFIPALILVMFALCYIFLPILYDNKLDNCYTVIQVPHFKSSAILTMSLFFFFSSLASFV